MRKTYSFGEMMLVLREEYKECKKLFEELNKCISIESKYDNSYFSGSLPISTYVPDEDIPALGDREIYLFVKKKYLNILKMINYVKYDWYGEFLYSSIFKVDRKEGGLYSLSYDNMLTPVDGKKYIPRIEIIDQNKFSSLIDELLSSDLMQLKREYFVNNYDSIFLDFQTSYVNTLLGNSSTIAWNGVNDTFKYTITKYNRPFLLKDILSLEMPVDNISPEWLKLLEKHGKDFGDKLVFDVDENDKSKNGVLYVSDEEKHGVVKLLKRTNKN